MDLDVVVTVPEALWGRAATVAEQTSTTVGQVIGEALAVRLAATPRMRMPEPDRLAELVAEVRAAKRAGYRAPRTNRNQPARSGHERKQ